ncbi:MAG: PAS domain-containing protein [bacterium]|nr:PAS domain-containing protein [bacterium]
MTTAKRLGLTTIALVSMGASAAYYATTMAMKGHGVLSSSLNYLVLALIAALTILMLLVFWRSMHRAMSEVSTQISHMASTGDVGMVMVRRNNELSEVTTPLNKLLTNIQEEIESLRSEKRELQIQSRITSAEKHHTEAIIFSISDAVIVTNRFDELVLANEAAEQLLGFKLKTSLRKNIDRIFSDGSLVRLIRETRNHSLSSKRKIVEHCIDKNGTAKTFTVTLSCVEASSDEVSGVVAVLHDITREKEIARMKTDFVSNVSHELKTPLASIKAYIEMLIDGEAEDEQTKLDFYDIISGETDRLHRLIENILNISRIESGVVKIVREPTSLTGVVKRVLDVASPQAKLKEIELEERLAPVFYQIEADQDMIYQAVMNLVSNAIKYTPKGGRIVVEVSVDERRGVAVCTVMDDGAGVPEADLPHIFEKFYRVNANKKLAKGTGLGLTLVKHIVESVHNGELSVTSEEGHGSTFCFELPVLT